MIAREVGGRGNGVIVKLEKFLKSSQVQTMATFLFRTCWSNLLVSERSHKLIRWMNKQTKVGLAGPGIMNLVYRSSFKHESPKNIS